MSEESRAISKAAGIPLPATSPSVTREPLIGQFDEIVVIAADFAGGVVVSVEFVAGQFGHSARQEVALHLPGHVELAFDALLGQLELVEAGVFHGDRRLRRHPPQQPQIVLREFLVGILRVKLDDAERLPLSRKQRHAHDGADVEGDDAFGGVARHGGAPPFAQENRLLGAQALADNGVAEIGGSIVAAARLHEFRLQAAGIFVHEDDEAAVGLGEQPKQAVDNFGELGIELQRFAQFGGDFEERRELGRRLGVEAVIAVGAEHRLHGRGAILLRFGGRVEIGGLELADADRVLVGQGNCA